MKVVLIIIAALLLFGPIMYGVAKLNKIDPFILRKSWEEIENDHRSFVLVCIMYPLYVPLWIEAWIIRKLKKDDRS
jgi:hypothetical protein